MASTINSTTTGSGGLITTGDASNELQIQTGDATRITVTSAGNVGIGTSSPVVPLQVANASPAMSLNATGSITSGSRGDFNVYNSSISTCGYVRFGAITDNVGTDIQFANRPAGGSLTERMRIDSSGNVGVNNTSPAVLSSTTQVAVKANTSADAMFVAQNSNGLTTAKFGFQFTGSVDNPVIGSYTNHPFLFLTNNTERMRIDSSGNVGIGTSSPDQKLVVNGGASDTYLKVTGQSRNGFFGQDSTGLAVYQAASAPIYFVTAATERMRIDSSGNLRINTTTGTGRVYIFEDNTQFYGLVCNSSSDTGTQYFLEFRRQGNTAGYLTSNNSTSVQLNNTSDVRLKENIQDAGSALPSVMAARVRQFDWKENRSPHQDFGFVAQELVNVIPEAVTVGTDNEDGTVKMPWGVDYSHIVPRLVKAIQELKAENDALKARLDAAGL